MLKNTFESYEEKSGRIAANICKVPNSKVSSSPIQKERLYPVVVHNIGRADYDYDDNNNNVKLLKTII